jgi:two-component system sensor histidine kinase KdpD
MNHRSAIVARHTTQAVWPGSAGVAVVTLISYRLHFNYAMAGFLYLLVVVVLSIAGSFLYSAIISILAVGCLDYFFVPPIMSLRVVNSHDALALTAFLLTALVITQQASTARSQTESARWHRKELELLFRASGRLLTLEPEAAAVKCPGIFRDIFDFQAVCVFEAVTAEARSAGLPLVGLAERTRDAYLEDRDVDNVDARITLRCLRVEGKTIGAIGFEAASCSKAVAGALCVLCASTLERARTNELSIKATANARAEALRSAILDAFAHEFKTPLTAILAAAGGLAEVGHLNSQQRELVALIESETSRLGQLTTRLLRRARLDNEEVKPRLRVTDLSALVATVVNRRLLSFADRTLSLDLPREPVRIMADEELLSLAFIPLLDNALKYSRSGSVVTIRVSRDRRQGVVRVRNEGSSIAPEEVQRVFERHHRGKYAQQAAPGVGLGLYVAQKIVVAHRGTLELESEPAESGAVTFCVRLPSSEFEVDSVPRAS